MTGTIFVGDIIDVYTTQYGWALYSLMWGILTVTGLVLYPFLRLLYEGWHNAKEKSGATGGEAPGALNQMEMGLLVKFLVVVLAAVPLFPIELAQIKHLNTCSGAVVEGGNTGTTWDDTMGSFTTLTSGEVRVPMAYYAAMAIGGGLNTAIAKNINCLPKMDLVEKGLGDVKLRDQDANKLHSELGRFVEECYKSALATFATVNYGRSGGGVPAKIALENAGALYEKGFDLGYVGSEFLLNTPGMYLPCPAGLGIACPDRDLRKARAPVEGFAYSASRDGQYSEAQVAAGTPGTPGCAEWWGDTNSGLRNRLAMAAEVDAPFVEGADNSAQGNINQMQSALGYFVGYSTDDKVNYVVRRLTADYSSARAADYDNQFNAQGWFGAAAAGVASFFSPVKKAAGGMATYAATEGAAKALDYYVTMYVIKLAAPIALALVLMLIYGLLPLFIVIGEYKFTAALTAIFLIISLQLFTSLWFIAAHIDSSLYLTMYPDESTWGTIWKSMKEMSLEGPEKRIILDMVSTAMWVVAPMVLMGLIGLVGFKINQTGMAVGSSSDKAAGGVGGAGAGIRGLGKK